MARARMSEDGAVVIPKAMRDAHGLRPGSEFEVIDGGGTITLRPLETDLPAPFGGQTLTMAGFLASIPKYDGPPVDLSPEGIRHAIDQAVIEDWQRLERQWDDDKNG